MCVDWGSDSTRESLEEFKCPFSREEVVPVREEMDELTAWDDEYFARREELFREMEEIVEGVLQTGNATLPMLSDVDVDVAEYFAAAKDVMKDIQDKAEESRRLLANKMQVWPLHLEADYRNATPQKRRPDRDFLLYWMTNNLLSVGRVMAIIDV